VGIRCSAEVENSVRAGVFLRAWEEERGTTSGGSMSSGEFKFQNNFSSLKVMYLTPRSGGGNGISYSNSYKTPFKRPKEDEDHHSQVANLFGEICPLESSSVSEDGGSDVDNIKQLYLKNLPNYPNDDDFKGILSSWEVSALAFAGRFWVIRAENGVCFGPYVLNHETSPFGSSFECPKSYSDSNSIAADANDEDDEYMPGTAITIPARSATQNRDDLTKSELKENNPVSLTPAERDAKLSPDPTSLINFYAPNPGEVSPPDLMTHFDDSPPMLLPNYNSNNINSQNSLSISISLLFRIHLSYSSFGIPNLLHENLNVFESFAVNTARDTVLSVKKRVKDFIVSQYATGALEDYAIWRATEKVVRVEGIENEEKELKEKNNLGDDGTDASGTTSLIKSNKNKKLDRTELLRQTLSETHDKMVGYYLPNPYYRNTLGMKNLLVLGLETSDVCLYINNNHSGGARSSDINTVPSELVDEWLIAVYGFEDGDIVDVKQCSRV